MALTAAQAQPSNARWSGNAHSKLTSGEYLGCSFYFMLYGNEVQLYWYDGEMSSYTLQPGEDPQEVANQWKEEILNEFQSIIIA